MSPLRFLVSYLCFGTVQASLSQEWSPDTGRVILKVGTFSWDNCGGGKDPGVIKNLSIQPDPVIIPGTLQARAVATTSVNLVAPLEVDLTLKKEVAGNWLKIPCVDQIGSCKYDDVCQLLNLAIPPGQECPEPLFTYGIPCHCPFKAGDYSLPETSFYIPPMELPYWLTNGNYKANAIMMHGSRELACVDLSFSIKTV
uniref:ganglioside GM2 activator-like n=1 Tax=Pristiophorus japonicus TaxID=55135 RepID=UPI00398F8AAF